MQKTMFFILRKNKTYKHKKKITEEKKLGDFSYASKGILKLIISNIDVSAGCVLAMNSLPLF